MAVGPVPCPPGAPGSEAVPGREEDEIAAMQWVGHRDLFTLIRDTDRGIVCLNLLTLFAACLLPFGSALLSRYHQDRWRCACSA